MSEAKKFPASPTTEQAESVTSVHSGPLVVGVDWPTGSQAALRWSAHRAREIGASAGAGFAQLIAPVWPFSEISPGAFALVGMAATFSAVARAPLTSILIVFEITGDYGLVLPLMVATIVSTSLAARLRPESAYTAPLARKGIHPASAEITDLLGTITVGDTMGAAPVSIEPDTALSEALQVMAAQRTRSLPVVEGGRLRGVVKESDIRPLDSSANTKVREVMTPDPATVTPATAVADALERMAALGVGSLPIILDPASQELVGVFSRDDVVSAYHQALGMYGRHSSKSARPLTGNSETGFYDIEIPVGSAVDGLAVKEIRWPENSVAVSIHRAATVIVPNGDTKIVAGDAVTLFGPSGTIDALEGLVADEPDHPE